MGKVRICFAGLMACSCLFSGQASLAQDASPTTESYRPAEIRLGPRYSFTTRGAFSWLPRCPVSEKGDRLPQLLPLIPESFEGFVRREPFSLPVYIASGTRVTLQLSRQELESIPLERYQRSYEIPEKTGIFLLTIDPEEYSLEPGKSYVVSITASCEFSSQGNGNRQQIEEEVYKMPVQSRVLPSAINQQLDALQSKELAEQLLQENLWYEAIALLLELRQTQPDDPEVSQFWNTALGRIEDPDGLLDEQLAAIQSQSASQHQRRSSEVRTRPEARSRGRYVHDSGGSR